ncbi:MAG: leucine-rich repeat protein [Acidobacteriota bacterium]|nr:leucine-rich repeat protein [Acidobacteriota bacterium]
MEVTRISTCGQVTGAHLSSVRRLDLSASEITELKQNDFSGLNSLEWLRLNENSLTELPQGIFNGLNSLKGLWLQNNSLAALRDTVFSGLGRLRELVLFQNSLSVLPEGIFSGLVELRTLRLQDNSLRTLPEGVFQGLHNLSEMTFLGNSLRDLPGEIFSGLSNLKHLNLGRNSLGSLPKDIFSGLNALADLGLSGNQLSELPEEIFSDLNSLETLWLVDNPLSTLPAGIFDDVLDTMGSSPHGPGLGVDNHMKASLAFAATSQIVFSGTNVTVTVTLSRELPVAVRLPYSLGGSATENDYANLSPQPESGLLFPAGETSKEIRFALPESDDRPGKTIVLTLGELSRVRLRRSDGSPPDAPFLKAETLVDRPEDLADHTVTISSPNQPTGLCNRTPQVRDKLLEITGIPDCAQVTLGRLAEVTRLDLSGSGLTALQAHDFGGLVALHSLLLNNNSLRTPPEGVFSGLKSLRVLWLQGNGFNSLPLRVLDEVIHRLEDLRVDPRLSASLAFESSAQETVTGATVRVRVWLSRALPVAVRVPYSVSGTATETDYGGLFPSPEVGLLFPAGETGGQIVFTPLEDSEALGKTVVLTLGELSEIGLRRSDGSGDDAPGLDAGVLVDRPAAGAVHTVTMAHSNQPADVCERTPQVRDALVERLGRVCEDITTAHLAEVRILSVDDPEFTTLQAHDFSGLIALEYLLLDRNSLTSLAEEVFSELTSLKGLRLQDNSLSMLPEGVFQGLNSLRELYLYRNSLSVLPPKVFRGLGNLRELRLWGNSLTGLPPGVFQGLSKLEDLELGANHLNQLPEGIFSGLDNLRSLWLSLNPINELPEGVFDGLSKLEELRLLGNHLEDLPVDILDGLDNLRLLVLSGNPLKDLPEGILDDVLDTLGGEYTVDFGAGVLGGNPNVIQVPYRGHLSVDSDLKATLAFASTETEAPEGATVRVPVTLSRELPVSVRVPYSVGFGGASAGYTNLSPALDSGLLFPAGETRGQISFTLLRDTAAQGERSLVLTLGKPTEIRLRRSHGEPPDAPDLRSDSLVLRSKHQALHTVTVSDVDPAERDPFCLSLWQDSPCSTVAILPHLFLGPLGEHLANTEVAVTHKDPEAAHCEVAVLFDQGTSMASAVSFSGRFPDGNLFRTTLPRGGAELLTLTAPDAGQLTSGALYVFARSPCQTGSLQVQARHLLESPSDGETVELFSVDGQSENDWLGDGDCRRLTAMLRNGDNVGLASVTTRPGQSAPPGTRLRFAEFDLNGNLIGSLGSLEIYGQHHATYPWSLDRPATIQMCLDVPGASDFQLAIDALGTTAGGAKVQFSTVIIPGDTGPDDRGPSR